MTEEEYEMLVLILKEDLHYERFEYNRKDRTWNISIALVHHFINDSDSSFVSSSSLREEIRREIQC